MTAHIRLVSPPGEERRDLEGEGAEADEAPVGLPEESRGQAADAHAKTGSRSAGEDDRQGTGSLAMRRLRSSPSRRIARVAVPAPRPASKRRPRPPDRPRVAAEAEGRDGGSGAREPRQLARGRQDRIARADGRRRNEGERPPCRRNRDRGWRGSSSRTDGAPGRRLSRASSAAPRSGSRRLRRRPIGREPRPAGSKATSPNRASKARRLRTNPPGREGVGRGRSRSSS